MNPTNRLKCTRKAKLRPQSASIGLQPRILSGGGLLGGMIEFGRMLLR
jgi:hypothetical protein